YYGDGFAQRQCGITVESPSAADYGSWRCTVGVQKRVGTVIEQRTPLQALIRVTGSQTTRSGLQRVTTDRTIFVQKEMTITITCEADASLTYCWFQHPNGTQYSGESLSVGDCGITFTHVTEEDGGVWTCHMGPRYEVGVEITDRVNVRVTGPLAAREKCRVGPFLLHIRPRVELWRLFSHHRSSDGGRCRYMDLRRSAR
ncbi:Uncharacterized protein OBRU01_20095, partial [Operophtera brumata]